MVSIKGKVERTSLMSSEENIPRGVKYRAKFVIAKVQNDGSTTGDKNVPFVIQSEEMGSLAKPEYNFCVGISLTMTGVHPKTCLVDLRARQYSIGEGHLKPQWKL